MSTPSLRLGAGLRLRAPISRRALFWSQLWSGLWSWLEWMLAGALLIVLMPLLAAVVLAVAVASRKSPFIAHRRVGRYGQDFWMLKIRTMWDRNQPSGPRGASWIEYLGDTHVPIFKGKRDPRVTSKLALFVRRFSLDELPQLVHVLNGSMRLVGPRPITRIEWDTYYGPSAAEVLSVSPGLTGLWQVMGRNRLTYAQRRRLDLFYARHSTPQLDLLLLLRTPVRVLSGRDSG